MDEKLYPLSKLRRHQRIYQLNFVKALRARMHDAVNDPHLRQSFRGAMDFLMAKRAAQFPDAEELESLRTLGEHIRQYNLGKLPDLLVQALERALKRHHSLMVERATCRLSMVMALTSQPWPSMSWRISTNLPLR